MIYKIFVKHAFTERQHQLSRQYQINACQKNVLIH